MTIDAGTVVNLDTHNNAGIETMLNVTNVLQLDTKKKNVNTKVVYHPPKAYKWAFFNHLRTYNIMGDLNDFFK